MLSLFVGQKLGTFIASVKTDLKVLAELIEVGKVIPVIDRIYALGDAPQAIMYLDEGPFQHEFRKYQHMMLSRVDAQSGDHRHHLVSPPGSGKTIVGLELIRRFGRPARHFVVGRVKVHLMRDVLWWVARESNPEPTD